jgi:hypothetical protein
MQRKSKSRIGVILFLFILGFACIRIGLFFQFRSIDLTGAVHLLLSVIGALCIILAVYLMKKRWF